MIPITPFLSGLVPVELFHSRLSTVVEKGLCYSLDMTPSYETVAKGSEFRSHTSIKTD